MMSVIKVNTLCKIDEENPTPVKLNVKKLP